MPLLSSRVCLCGLRQELISEFECRMLETGHATLVSNERAIAIRALLATSEDETYEQAIERAIADVLASRLQ